MAKYVPAIAFWALVLFIGFDIRFDNISCFSEPFCFSKSISKLREIGSERKTPYEKQDGKWVNQK